MNYYPDTPEKRRAGMDSFRAQMLVQHERMLASGKLNAKDRAYTESLIATIKNAQSRAALKEVA